MPVVCFIPHGFYELMIMGSLEFVSPFIVMNVVEINKNKTRSSLSVTLNGQKMLFVLSSYGFIKHHAKIGIFISI